MTFDDLLDQIVELLQRRGRVTYRALKRRFDLDDEYLEDLKGEILFAHPQVRDEDGQGLVWMGDTEATPQAPPPTPQPRQIPNVQETASDRAEQPLSELSSPDAERRQLTVMFCDLVGSTQLSGQLDPEDLRDVVRAYQETAAGVIQRYEGHIAQYLGDGLLVYFGWPQAHEDDARRGVHAGLGIAEAITTTLNPRLEKDKGVRLAVRIGIHTGPVVIGEMGGGGRHEQLALGETTNIASRLEGMAQPNTVVISDITYRLIAGYFACDDLGLHDLKGVATPVQTYQALQATGMQGRVDVAISHGLTPLVGRESEVSLLLKRWQQVQDGEGQVILLSGEAGIGKSRLVQVLKDHVTKEPHTRLECRSSSYYQNTALYPITALLQRMLQWQQDDTPDEKLSKLEQILVQYSFSLEETVPLFAALLSLPVPGDRYPPLALSPQQQRQRTLNSIVAMLLERSESQPVLFILEDLHWTDPSTLELLGLLIDQTPTATICVLLTCRSMFQPPWSPRSYLAQVTLNRLSGSQLNHMVEQVAGGKRLPADIRQQIIEKTDGVPLFVEEVTRVVLESGMLQEANAGDEPVGSQSVLAIPTTLQDSLMARLDRLNTAKAVAQYAAVIGRQFSYDLLREVSQLDDATLQQELSRLIEAELLYQRGMPPQATFTFKHALVQDAAYEMLLRSKRQQYHATIADVLLRDFPDQSAAEPELVARHLSLARRPERAVEYWLKAGQRASERSEHFEAKANLEMGLEELERLEQSPSRDAIELDIRIFLGASLLAVQGWSAPLVQQNYERAQELGKTTGDMYQKVAALHGLANVFFLKGELKKARQLAEQELSMAQNQDDQTLLMGGYRAVAMCSFFAGEFEAARETLTLANAMYDQSIHGAQKFIQGTDPAVIGLSVVGWANWFLGHPEEARRKTLASLDHAKTLHHPFSLTYAQCLAASTYQVCRMPEAVQEHADAAIANAETHDYRYWMGWAGILRGWALASLGNPQEGIKVLQHGLETYQSTGARQIKPYALTMLAETYGWAGMPQRGVEVLEGAFGAGNTSDVCFYEAEALRLKGQLLLSWFSNGHAKAETCFYKALDVSRHQQAKSLELRAVTSLARLWQSQGKHQEAYDVLAPVYEWFTEGFNTADLQDAKALLSPLGRVKTPAFRR